MVATSPLESQLPDRVFLPSQDWTLNTTDLNQLLPSHSARLMYLEQPRSSLAMSTTMAMIFPVVILENSAFVKSLHCSSDGSISITFSDLKAFGKARQWPEKDLVLVTNRLSCNAAHERGVFLTQQIIHDLEALVVTVQTQSVAWKDVAKTMTIDYLEIEDKSDLHRASEVDQDGSHGEL